MGEHPPFLGPVLYVTGLLACGLGMGMLVPMGVDLYTGSANWQAFAGSSAATLAISVSVILATAGHIQRFDIRQTFLMTTLAWVFLSLVGALPLMLAEPGLKLTDALFESTSGLTTTGATVITALDTQSPGLLLWRALLHWYGGIGIIVMAIAILPVLHVGGMQLFRTESSRQGQRPLATVRDTASGILKVYSAITVLSILAFAVAGMDWLEAICHAMSAVATGGFSTHDASLGYYLADPEAWSVIAWIAIVSMIAGSIPLTLPLHFIRHRTWRVLADSQVLTLFGILLAGWVGMTSWTFYHLELPFWEALRTSAFHVTSVTTGTGLTADDYSKWGHFATLAFLLLFFVGGCTGSTTGSIKIFRWQILMRALIVQLTRMQQPRRVIPQLYQGRTVDREVMESIINLILALIICWCGLSLALAAMDIDLLTSISASASVLTGVGPGLGPIAGPSASFATLPDPAKWLLCAGMLLGRLEIFTVLVLFTPTFWKN